MKDILIIALLSFTSAAIAEAIAWFLVYRTSAYKNMAKNIERQNKKIDKMKEDLLNNPNKKNEKKLQKDEEHLKQMSRDISMLQMKSTLAATAVLLGTFNILGQLYSGVVVAKLPFEPISLISALSHRNLPGNDFTDCSAYFIYALCSLIIRPNLQRALGFQVKRMDTMSAFMPTVPNN